MSNLEQAGSAVVGATVGFFIGGPTGLTYGFQIGLLAGQALFPTQLPKQFGPRLTDIQTTVAQLGQPVGITYGTFAVPGQIMALGCVVETERSERVGGKGGPPEQTIVNFTYSQTIGVGLCEGIICGIQRAWENGELKFDTRPQQVEETDADYAARIEMSGQYALTFTLYLGDEEQEADPDLELVFGEGLVPAFRGLAYIVFPDRALREDQALRHPQWRFEVLRGVTERGVTEATLLDGPLEAFQIDKLMPDWANDRFFCFDLVGTSSGKGIRAFRLRSNTEYLQRTLEDIGIGDPIGFHEGTVGVDGFLYLSAHYDGSSAVFYRIDPETLEIVATGSGSLAANDWIQAITIRVAALGQVVDFLITLSVLFNSFRVKRCDSFDELAAFADNREEGLLCRGPVSGSHAYAYGLSYDEFDTSTNDGIDLLKFDCSLEPSIDPISGLPIVVADAEITTVGRIPHSDLQSDWVRVVEVAGLVFDSSDNTVIFSVTGATTTSITPTNNRLVKIDPETLEVIWSVADTAGVQPVFGTYHNLSRIARDRYMVAAPSGHTALVDTRTGEQTLEDWTAILPGSGQFSGEEIYDGVTNCLLTFISNQPVLLCGPGCGTDDISLGEIVADLCERAGVPEDGYDVSDLTQTVHGYGVMRNMPARQAIEVLRPVGSFDGVESGLVIKFPTRGAAPVRTLALEDLSAHQEGEPVPPAVTTDKTQSVELPRIVRVHYLAPSREYEPSEKLSPSRFSPGIENEVDVEVPVALDDSQAFQIAEIVHSDAWAGRWKHQVNLDASQLELEPADVVLVPVDGRLYRCRIDSIDDSHGGLLRRVALIRDDDGSYVSSALASPPQTPFPPAPTVTSATLLVLLDLPPLREEDDNAGIYAAVYRAQTGFHWTGAVIARSVDEGATWSQLSASAIESTVGTLLAELGVAEPTSWDTRNSLLVDVAAGEFESRDETALLNGANTVAVGANGRWEIVQFRDAEAIGSTTVRLSYLLRGRRGTEVHIGSAQEGDQVVLLSDGALLRLGLQTTDIGQEHLYRATTIGLAAGATESQAFTGAGQALEAWAPVRIIGERDPGNDLTITFSRRSRFGSDLTPAGHNLPMTEEPEAYEIDIIGSSAGDVLRTIETAVESAVYTEAEQIADFGSAQAAVELRIYQLSTIVGRGLAGEATV